MNSHHFTCVISSLALKLWMLVVGMCGLHSALAQSPAPLFPGKPIRLVVPFPAGGSADIVARVMAQPLAEKLGQPVLIDNKPGADGAIAAEAVAAATPDGHTLFFATYGAMSAVPFLHKTTHYDPLKDFSPISTVGKFSMFIFAHESLPVHNLQELIAYAHAHKGEINYGTGNMASVVISAALDSMADMHMTQVPYKGEVPAMADFVAGRIQIMLATPTNALPFVRQGRLKALASLSEKRSPLMPDTMTWSESGLHELPMISWAGIFAPARVPPQTIQRLSTAVNQVLLLADVQKEFMKQGFESFGSTPAQLTTYVKTQSQAWAAAIHNAGLQPQ